MVGGKEPVLQPAGFWLTFCRKLFFDSAKSLLYTGKSLFN